jgi:hypothetical protein
MMVDFAQLDRNKKLRALMDRFMSQAEEVVGDMF